MGSSQAVRQWTLPPTIFKPFEADPPLAENLTMFYIYVLKSLSHGTLYIGSSEDPEVRLKNKHNKGKVRYTKGRMPWEIIYKEEFATRAEAMKREKFLKSGQGREFLKRVIK